MTAAEHPLIREYEAACAALRKHRACAEAAEVERDRLVTALGERAGELLEARNDRDMLREQLEAAEAERDELAKRAAWRLTRTYDQMAADLSAALAARAELAAQVRRLNGEGCTCGWHDDNPHLAYCPCSGGPS